MTGKQQALMIKMLPLAPQKIAMLDSQDQQLAVSMAHGTISRFNTLCDHCRKVPYPCTGGTGWQPCAFCQMDAVPCTYSNHQTVTLPNQGATTVADVRIRSDVKYATTALTADQTMVAPPVDNCTPTLEAPKTVSNSVPPNAALLEALGLQTPPQGSLLLQESVELDDFQYLLSGVDFPSIGGACTTAPAHDIADDYVFVDPTDFVFPVSFGGIASNLNSKIVQEQQPRNVLVSTPTGVWPDGSSVWPYLNDKQAMQIEPSGSSPAQVSYPPVAGRVASQASVSNSANTSRASAQGLAFSSAVEWAELLKEIDAAFPPEVDCRA